LFSGEYWTGRRGRELGLVDGIGDLRTTLRERYGEKVRMPLIAEKGFSLFGRRAPGVSLDILSSLWGSPSLADDVVSTLEARALWARYGL
jgi:serine protease SohB